jgi:hypothetical protein
MPVSLYTGILVFPIDRNWLYFQVRSSMAKSYKNRKNQTHSCRGAATKVSCTELLVVDQAPFLKKAMATCKRLRKELHKKQALLNDFEENDRNAFQQWLTSTHGQTLTQIRELREEANAFQFILHHLSQCAYHDYESVPELFEELFKRKKQGTLYDYVPPIQPDPYGFDAGEEDEEWDEDDDWDDEDDDDAMREFFDRMFGGGASGGAKSERSSGMRRQKVTQDARLKTCYRNLAKRLHPDHSELEESIRERRWHEIQEAYQNCDLEGLLRVEAICDMDEAGLSIKLGLARLRDLAAYHKSHLLPIRDALRAAKKDIAFGFSTKGPSAKVKRNVAEDLKFERLDVMAMLSGMKHSATSIRDEVVAQIRANQAACERALRRAETMQARKAKNKKGGSSKTANARGDKQKSKLAPNAKESDPYPNDPQMTFF